MINPQTHLCFHISSFCYCVRVYRRRLTTRRTVHSLLHHFHGFYRSANRLRTGSVGCYLIDLPHVRIVKRSGSDILLSTISASISENRKSSRTVSPIENV